MMETKAVLEILPLSIKNIVEELQDVNNLQEIRIKVNKPIIFQIGQKEIVHNYIALSDDYEDPVTLYGPLFDTILPAETLCITRKHDTIRKAFVFRMLDLKKEMVFK